MSRIKLGFLIVACSMAYIAVGSALFIVQWRADQPVSVADIEHKLHRGMSLDEVESALGQAPGSLARRIKYYGDGTWTDAKYGMTISRAGIVSMFISQDEIDLYFDGHKRALDGIVKTVFQLDENSRAIVLRPKLP